MVEGHRNESSLVMIGAFPPPVHGMAAVNAAVRQELEATGVAPAVIDIAAANLNRSLRSRLGRSLRVLRGLLRFSLMRGVRSGTLYMSVSGGLGQLYEILFLVLARVRSMRIYLHHHSFAYLDEPSWITALLAKAAGPSAIHIALSPRMAIGLSRVYPAIREAVPISNAVLVMRSMGSPTPSVRTQLRTLGYLSNISAEKGVFEFLDLLEAARRRGLPLVGRLGGPFQDENTEAHVRLRLAALPEVAYVGPQSDREKQAFLAGIDVLVFPTRYANEAEPLVMLEAMNSGVPIIAYARGAIGEVIGSSCGLSVPPQAEFLPLALPCLEEWLAKPELFQSMSQSALERFETLCRENATRWNILLASLIGTRAPSQQSSH
jgi:glycosyltransferase involved in cell wall biosynthesis